jgi:uncharacterized protein HemX
MTDTEPPPQAVEELRTTVASLASVVKDMQATLRDQLPPTGGRRMIGWIILLALVAAIVGLLITQRSDVAAQQQANITACENENNQLRAQRVLYQSLIVAEQQIPSTTGTNISIKQARIQAYTQAIGSIRLADCQRQYG